MTKLAEELAALGEQVVIPPEQIAALARLATREHEKLLALAWRAVHTPAHDAPVALAVLADAMLEANRLSASTPDPAAAAWQWAREQTWTPQPDARVSRLTTHLMLGLIERNDVPADYAYYVEQELAQRMFGAWPSTPWELAKRCEFYVFEIRPERLTMVRFVPGDERSHLWLEANAAGELIAQTLSESLFGGKPFHIAWLAAEMQRRLRAAYPRASLLVRARGSR